MAGRSLSGSPRYSAAGGGSATSAPASRRSRPCASYTAASPAPGDAANTPDACDLIASAIAFLTGAKENQRSKLVKPTADDGSSSFGKS